MILGVVVGKVWATKKADGLRGQTFLKVQAENGQTLVAADCVGAGEGETVLLATGGGARVAAGPSCPIDTAIVGIVDTE